MGALRAAGGVMKLDQRPPELRLPAAGFEKK
jgi:hypothetical protein